MINKLDSILSCEFDLDETFRTVSGTASSVQGLSRSDFTVTQPPHPFGNSRYELDGRKRTRRLRILCLNGKPDHEYYRLFFICRPKRLRSGTTKKAIAQNVPNGQGRNSYQCSAVSLEIIWLWESSLFHWILSACFGTWILLLPCSKSTV